jgi:hypothetical protein
MTVTSVFKRVLGYGGLLAGGIAVVGSIAGFAVAGPRGLVSALIGTAMAFVFLAVTAASIILANRSTKSDIFSPAFFGIVLGGWLLKFVVFLVLVFLLKDQPWIDNVVLFLSIVAGVLGSLVVDVLVVARARVPYVSDAALAAAAGRGSDETERSTDK